MLQLNFTPFPTLHTERLILRELQDADVDMVFFMRSDPEVLKYLGREPAQTKKEIEDFFVLIRKNLVENNGIYWIVALKEEPEKMIGSVCYWQLQPENYRAEIGYALHPEYWKKGLMKEAVLKVVEYGFEEMKLHSIEARLTAENKASAAVLEATGFVREGYFKEDVFFKGRFEDTLVYSKLSS